MQDPPRAHKYLLVTNWISWAGAETQLAHLAIGLSQNGHEVTMLATGKVIAEGPELKDAGVEVVSLGIVSRRLKPLLPARILPYARRADVVHCTGWDATLWGRVAALLARRPMVITEHTPGREYQVSMTGGASRARLIALHNRLLAPFTARTIVVGEWQQALLEAEGVDGSSIVHVPNAVPVAQLRERAAVGPGRADLGIPEDALVVVEVARFAPQKGQGTVLREVAKLRARLGDVRVVFVGEGETESAVKRLAEELGADWATFLGRREDVPGLLALADVSVLPSTGEGLPMSLIESIAIGTPVIGTDVGDVRWLIEQTGAGRWVPAGDDQAFGTALAELLEDRDLRQQLRRSAAENAGRFDSPVMVAAYEEVLEAAIDAGQTGA